MKLPSTFRALGFYGYAVLQTPRYRVLGLFLRALRNGLGSLPLLVIFAYFLSFLGIFTPHSKVTCEKFIPAPESKREYRVGALALFQLFLNAFEKGKKS